MEVNVDRLKTSPFPKQQRSSFSPKSRPRLLGPAGRLEKPPKTISSPTEPVIRETPLKIPEKKPVSKSEYLGVPGEEITVSNLPATLAHYDKLWLELKSHGGDLNIDEMWEKAANGKLDKQMVLTLRQMREIKNKSRDLFVPPEGSDAWMSTKDEYRQFFDKYHCSLKELSLERWQKLFADNTIEERVALLEVNQKRAAASGQTYSEDRYYDEVIKIASTDLRHITRKEIPNQPEEITEEPGTEDERTPKQGETEKAKKEAFKDLTENFRINPKLKDIEQVLTGSDALFLEDGEVAVIFEKKRADEKSSEKAPAPTLSEEDLVAENVQEMIQQAKQQVRTIYGCEPNKIEGLKIVLANKQTARALGVFESLQIKGNTILIPVEGPHTKALAQRELLLIYGPLYWLQPQLPQIMKDSIHPSEPGPNDDPHRYNPEIKLFEEPGETEEPLGPDMIPDTTKSVD